MKLVREYHCYAVNFRNLCPHDIVFGDGEYVFKREETIARVTSDIIHTDHFDVAGQGFSIPIIKRSERITGLPDPEENTIFIVSFIVLVAAKKMGRTDCIAPGSPIKDERGRVIAVNDFIA